MYEYLSELYDFDPTDSAMGYLGFWMTLGTGGYVLDDDPAYKLILQYYVYYTGDFNTPLATPMYYGDVNCDGKSSLHDIIAVNKMVCGIVRPSSYNQFISVDVNKSGIIDAEDVKLIMQNVLDIISIDPYSGEITYLADNTVYCH